MTVDHRLAAQLDAASQHADDERDRQWLDYVQGRLAATSQQEARRLTPAKSFDQLPVLAASSLWLVERLFPLHGVALVAGVPKARKSWFALDVAIAVASGQSFLERRRVAAGPVLFIVLEDQEHDIRTRLAALGAGRGLSPQQLAALPLWILSGSQLNLVDPATIHATIARGLMAMQHKLGPTAERFSLIVIDPLRDAHTANEDSSTEMRTVLRTLRDLHRAFGGLVLLTHHLAKGGGRQGGSDWDKVRGSGAILGSVDVALRFDDVQALTPDRLTATVHRINRAGRGSLPFSVALDVRDEDHMAVYAKWTEEAVDSHTATTIRGDMTAICEFLRAVPEGAARSRLRPVVGGSDSRVKAAEAALVREGSVTVTLVGKANIVRLAAPSLEMGKEGPLPSPL